MAREIDIDGWETSLRERELAENTVLSYLDSIRQYASAYGEVTKRDAVAWKRALIDRGLAVKTVNNRMIAVNQYAAWAGIPCGVKTIKQQKSYTVENVITVEQKDRLLDGLMRDGNMDGWCMVDFLAMTGVRVGELIQLEKKMLDDGAQLITNKGKTRKVYAPRQLINDTGPYLRTVPGRWLFTPRNDRGKQITPEAVRQRLHTYARRYGVPEQVCHPHSFRHLFGMQFMQRNGNISLLADVMGHSSVATTQIYTRMTEEEQRSQLDEAVTW